LSLFYKIYCNLNATMHEIITLQFGQQANHLGTHYWNTQESYFTYADNPATEPSPVNHDISFRAGLAPDGSDTYTPRTLLYDLKGAYGTLRRENALYEIQQEVDPLQQNPWGRRATEMRLPRIEPSPYQQALDAGSELPALTTETVRYWSDYNHVFYHPKSIVQLNEYEVNSSLMPFERYATGEDLFADLDREHDLLDRDLRPFLEECDHFQGLQIFSSTDDAWGGFTAKYLERVGDELGKCSRWVFALEEGKQVSRERRMLQLSNAAQSMHSVVPHASVYIPLSTLPTKLPPNITIDASSRWHTSALQAAVVESLTLPARLKDHEQGQARLDELEMALSGDGRRPIVDATLSVDDPANLHGDDPAGTHDARLSNGNANDASHDSHELEFSFLPELPPNANRHRGTAARNKIFTRFDSARGSWNSSLDVQEANTSLRDRYASGARLSIRQTPLLYPVLSSSPKIFHFPGPNLDKLAVTASLATSTRMSRYVRDVAGFARLAYGVDEREAVHDGLMGAAEEYEEGFSDLSSEESDGE
jgi:hypothetical protein